MITQQIGIAAHYINLVKEAHYSEYGEPVASISIGELPVNIYPRMFDLENCEKSREIIEMEICEEMEQTTLLSY